jgi:hypothetical protein
MRVGAGGRHNSNGGAWRHVEVEVVAAGGIGGEQRLWRVHETKWDIFLEAVSVRLDVRTTTLPYQACLEVMSLYEACLPTSQLRLNRPSTMNRLSCTQ